MSRDPGLALIDAAQNPLRYDCDRGDRLEGRALLGTALLRLRLSGAR